ncbi:hypothetical protein [Bacteroides timonensis]|uniref:hypothetical protein n=1 Tax=Bacteroides timonensis TaxID=1470345 RepID=UPI0004B980B8|nr:hypothetical protein [Bacteroides timonensis]
MKNDEKKIQLPEELVLENVEEVISNDDAEKLEGGIGFTNNSEDEIARPTEDIHGIAVCCGV